MNTLTKHHHKKNLKTVENTKSCLIQLYHLLIDKPNCMYVIHKVIRDNRFLVRGITFRHPKA